MDLDLDKLAALTSDLASLVEAGASTSVEHEGILELPKGKSFAETPAAHFIKLAAREGKKDGQTWRAAITRAVNNLARWEKHTSPKVAFHAKDVLKALKAHFEKNESADPQGGGTLLGEATATRLSNKITGTINKIEKVATQFNAVLDDYKSVISAVNQAVDSYEKKTSAAPDREEFQRLLAGVRSARQEHDTPELRQAERDLQKTGALKRSRVSTEDLLSRLTQVQERLRTDLEQLERVGETLQDFPEHLRAFVTSMSLWDATKSSEAGLRDYAQEIDKLVAGKVASLPKAPTPRATEIVIPAKARRA